jgi:hypothetical protein
VSAMIPNDELEIVASEDRNPPNYPYFEEGSVSIDIINRSGHPILIDWIELRFREEEGLISRQIKSTGPSGPLLPNHRSSSVSLQFRVPLTFTPASNYYDVGVTFRDASGADEPGGPKWYKSGRYIRVDTRPPRRKLVFISHSVPEDEARARQVKVFLEKVGISAYIWEEDNRPGALYWPEKLFPKIDECNGFVVIWSITTESRPDGVEKEINRARADARKAKHGIYPMLEDADGVRSRFPRFSVVFPPPEREHLKFDPNDLRPSLLALIEAIDSDIQAGRI